MQLNQSCLIYCCKFSGLDPLSTVQVGFWKILCDTEELEILSCMWVHGHRTCSCGRVSQGASAPVFHNALDVCYLTAIPTLVYLDNVLKNVSHINSPISDDQEELV
jgi:hypothetical protein